jgi:type IV pilus assembly protein PilM
MQNLFRRHRCGPIGLDIGARWVKLVQYTSDRTRLIDVARAEWNSGGDSIALDDLRQAIERARQGRLFVGHKVVVCLSDRQLFLQNVRVPKSQPDDIARQVQQEAVGRIPFKAEETELRFVEVADVRHLDTVLREVIVMACHRPVLQGMLDMIEQIGLQPVAVDVEPLALLRSSAAQYRRDTDQGVRMLMAHVGYRRTLAVISQDDNPLLIKVIDLGAKHLDEAVAEHLQMDVASAASLRRHHSDRRADQQDPEVTRSVGEAIRPVVDRLAAELSLCMRYHSVTFRGQVLQRVLLGGGESSPLLQEALNRQLDLKCELSNPFRSLPTVPNSARRGQWDIAAGLALRELAP